jgi:AcrR family transcriptional regulator
MPPNLHQTRSERTREHLLRSALTAMAEEGGGQISIQSVARAAGMTTGAVQHHFPSKAALMMQVLSRLIESLESGADFWPSLRWGLRRRADHFVQQAWQQLYGQPRFATAWTAYLAARDDAVMIAHIVEQRARLQTHLRTRFFQVFPEIARCPDADARFALVLSSLRGLGLVQAFAPASAIGPQLQVLSQVIQTFSTSNQETL